MLFATLNIKEYIVKTKYIISYKHLSLTEFSSSNFLGHLLCPWTLHNFAFRVLTLQRLGVQKVCHNFETYSPIFAEDFSYFVSFPTFTKMKPSLRSAYMPTKSLFCPLRRTEMFSSSGNSNFGLYKYHLFWTKKCQFQTSIKGDSR